MGFATVKRYGPQLHKIIYAKHAKPDPEKNKNIDRTKKGGEKKMTQSISRARNKVYEYAMCNEWDYFITLTLDPNKQDRSNLGIYHSALAFFLKKLNRGRSQKIRYLLIPEFHHDQKNWHMHGLIHGLRASDLTVNANGYLDWPSYRERFGYCSLSAIRNTEAVSKYILKYVGKGFNYRKVGDHLYYCSRGLAVAEHIGTGHLIEYPKWEYENKHCAIVWVKEQWGKWVDLTGRRVQRPDTI